MSGSTFWDDLREWIKDPEFRREYEAESTRLGVCACGHEWRKHDENGCMVCGCAGTQHMKEI